MNKKTGLIFDMDGTLWDSAANVAVSWELAVKECGHPEKKITEADIKSVMGKTMDVIADILFSEYTDEEKKHLLNACCDVENDYLRRNGGVLYPKLRETLEGLRDKGFHLYIVSNCQAGYIEAFLDYYKMWDLFEDIECFGNNGLTKDKNIRLLADRNGLDEDSYYVGDIQGDYDATMKAGLRFIHAAYGFGTINVPVTKIDSFGELIKMEV